MCIRDRIKWILENVKNAKKLLKSNNLLFGTVDTFLIWKLTNGKHHLTEATNASRTMLFNINNSKWDKEILNKLKISKNILPEIKNSADNFGFTSKKIIGAEIPISAVLGDQQAAAVGQSCFEKGSVKSTYGTGAFVIMNTGSKKIYSKNKLLTTICYRLNGKNTYALEGSIFNAGTSVQWLRDGLKIIKNASESNLLAAQANKNSSVFMVPAFTGLGAPYWNPNVRGAIFGLTRDSSDADLVIAALEAVCYQTYDLLEAMKADWQNADNIKLRVDGGMSGNNWMMQRLADILNMIIECPTIQETTALGAALVAALGAGIFKSLSQIAKKNRINKQFRPKMNKKIRLKLLNGWSQAIRKTII